MTNAASAKSTPALAISPEKVCFIVVKAREFDAKDIVTDPGDSSSATDDAMISVLEDHSCCWNHDGIWIEEANDVFLLRMFCAEERRWSQIQSEYFVPAKDRLIPWERKRGMYNAPEAFMANREGVDGHFAMLLVSHQSQE